jgi:hypothetical protein
MEKEDRKRNQGVNELTERNATNKLFFESDKQIDQLSCQKIANSFRIKNKSLSKQFSKLTDRQKKRQKRQIDKTDQ